MPQRPYDKPVSREQKIRTSSGLISLLWMFVGALIAVMIGFFLYLSPLFDGFKTDVEVNAPVKVEPLPQTNTPDDFEFYEVLPTREFQTGKSMTDIESAKQGDELITKPDVAPDAVVVFEQSDATKPKQENVSAGQTDAVLITEEELTYDDVHDHVGDSIHITAPNNSYYILQIRSYDSPDEADRMRAEVMMSGVNARVVKRVDDGVALYQVISDVMHSKEEAIFTSRKLSSHGIDSLVVEQRR